MALQNTISIYQADLMHITPEADASIYGYGGDWVLYGADITTDTNSVTIGAGKMLIAGRLVEVAQPTELPRTQVAGATSFHLSLEVDLTQTNSDSAGVVTNNQFQFLLTTEDPYGDLLAGDTQALITVANINTTAGTVTPVILPYSEDVSVLCDGGAIRGTANMTFRRRGVWVYASFNLQGSGSGGVAASTSHTGTLVNGTIPPSVRPVVTVYTTFNVGGVWFTNKGSITSSGSATWQYLRNKSGNVSTSNPLSAGGEVYMGATVYPIR